MADQTLSAPSVLETADLARRLRETEAELTRVTTRLRRLESSTAVQVATVMIAGARDPRRAPVTVPRELVRLGRRWRARGGNRTPTPLDPPAPGRAAGQSVGVSTPPAATGAQRQHDELATRLLAGYARTLQPRTRPVVAAIVAEAGARLGETTHLTRLRPDDASAVLAAVGAEVLLVDTRAATSGVWAHLGTFDAPERERTLLDLVHRAQAADIRTVLWAEAEPAGGWAQLAALFDTVVVGDEAALLEAVAA